MLPCVPCYFLVSLAMSISLLIGAAVAAAAPSPELTFLREVLNIKREAVIHLTLARAAFALYNESASSPQLHQALNATGVAHPHLVDNSFHSPAPFPPYVDAKPNHARWGLGHTAAPQPIVDFYYHGLIGASNASSLGSLRPDPLTLATTSAAWLNSVSDLISLGEQIAIAKYNASPANFSVPVHNHDASAVRKLLTVPQQEEVVKEGIRRKAEDWQKGAATIVPVEAFVTLFEDYLIPWTTDVEVATLLDRYDEAKGWEGRGGREG